MELESKIQAKLIKKLEKEGYYVIKLISTNKNGIPDLVALPDNCGAIFIEVKQKGKKPEPLQKFRAKEIINRGMKALGYDGEFFDII